MANEALFTDGARATVEVCVACSRTSLDYDAGREKCGACGKPPYEEPSVDTMSQEEFLERLGQSDCRRTYRGVDDWAIKVDRNGCECDGCKAYFGPGVAGKAIPVPREATIEEATQAIVNAAKQPTPKINPRHVFDAMKKIRGPKDTVTVDEDRERWQARQPSPGHCLGCREEKSDCVYVGRTGLKWCRECLETTCKEAGWMPAERTENEA